jgi:hypothetical protein
VVKSFMCIKDARGGTRSCRCPQGTRLGGRVLFQWASMDMDWLRVRASAAVLRTKARSRFVQGKDRCEGSYAGLCMTCCLLGKGALDCSSFPEAR